MGNTKGKEFTFQQHSIRYAQMASRLDRMGHIENPDGYGKRTGVCGDTIEMFLTIKDQTIKSVYFIVYGCINTLACANTVALLAEGKSIDDAWEITPQEVIEYLESLPSGEMHCAELAVGAFYLALSSIQENGSPFPE